VPWLSREIAPEDFRLFGGAGVRDRRGISRFESQQPSEVTLGVAALSGRGWKLEWLVEGCADPLLDQGRRLLPRHIRRNQIPAQFIGALSQARYQVVHE
jgi:hypothetical protein